MPVKSQFERAKTLLSNYQSMCERRLALEDSIPGDIQTEPLTALFVGLRTAVTEIKHQLATCSHAKSAAARGLCVQGALDSLESIYLTVDKFDGELQLSIWGKQQLKKIKLH